MNTTLARQPGAMQIMTLFINQDVRYMMAKRRALTWRRWLAIAALALAGSAAAAEVAAGMVKKTTGTVRIERGGVAIPAQAGTVVMARDRIVTDANSSVGLTLKDDTRLAAGPDSVLALDRFDFDSTTNDGSMFLQVVKGTLRAITGLIARQSPESVQVRTPTATIGIRGTDFIVEVSAND